MKLRFTIRDLLWLTLVVGLVLALYLERRGQIKGIEIQEQQSVQIKNLLDEEGRLLEYNRTLQDEREGHFEALKNEFQSLYDARTEKLRKELTEKTK